MGLKGLTLYAENHAHPVTQKNDYDKLNPPKRNFTQKCHSCEEFKKLFLKLKEHEEQCYQLKQQINFVRHQINQIKSVGTKLKLASLNVCGSH